jgi:hypothetical protein
MQSRRHFLYSLGAISLASAGCLESDSETEDEPSNSPNQNTPNTNLEPKSLPDKPEPLTENNVKKFVKEYEEVSIFNQYLNDDTIEISVNCPSNLDIVSEEGFYLITLCQGGVTERDRGDTVTAGEFGSEPTYYFVSEDQTDRIAGSVWKESETFGGGEKSSEVQGFRIINFYSKELELPLTVKYENRDEQTTVLDKIITISEGTIYNQSAFTSRPGLYTITIDHGDQEFSYQWEISDIEPPYGLNIVVTESSEILFGDNSISS